MTSKTRFIFIHGNGTTHWSFAWAGWLQQQLQQAGYETVFETMPDSVVARSEYWLPFLQDHLRVGEHDVLIGWSTGAVAAMRYAETHKIKGSILIGPCYTDLGDDMEKQSGYYDKLWDWEAIRANQHRIALFYGDDDPFIPQQEFVHIARQLQPEVHKMHAAGHFIERESFPELLDYITAVYARQAL